MKQALNYSGPFLESALLNIAQGQPNRYPAMDFQTGLLRLARAIRARLESAASLRIVQTQHSCQATASTQTQMTTPADSSASILNAAKTNFPANNYPAGDTRPEHPEIPQAQARATASVTMMTTEHPLQQLLQHTEGGLARMLTQQLHSANHDPQRPLWLLELPVCHDNGVDVFDLRIQRDGEERHAAEQAHHTWTVMLTFDLQGPGPVRAQVKLVQDQISSYWWADQASTVELFHQHLGRCAQL